MPEKEPVPQEEQQKPKDIDLLKEIENLKANTVSKEEYQKVVDEKQQIIDEVINKRSSNDDQTPSSREPNEIRKELLNPHTNLKCAELMLELRDSCIEHGEPDPFLPVSSQRSPTGEDIAGAEKSAKVLSEAVEYAEGSPELFNKYLEKHVNPTDFDKKYASKRN